MALEKLVALLGRSMETEEIKNLFLTWGVKYPRKITCTADNPRLELKMERDCVRLYFGRGGNSAHLRPIPAKWEGGYISIFTMIEFTKKRKGGMPFDVEFAMTPEELTAILGKPKETEFMGKMTTWRKNVTDKHEFVVCDTANADGTALRSMTLTFIYEAD